MASLTVIVPKTVALIAKVQRSGNPKKPATYSTWKPLDDVKILDIFCGSSVVGHSTAKITIVKGNPTGMVDVETTLKTVAFGDRIALGLQTGSADPSWQFCGYVVSSQIMIDDKTERLAWKLAGPEWWLGDGGSGNGSGQVIRGQFRRKSAADDAWRKKPSVVTKYEDWELFSDEKAVFNPGGRRNMTRDDVYLTPKNYPPEVKGKIWEMEDRRIGDADVAVLWDMRHAAQTIFSNYADSEFSGIPSPDWSTVPMTNQDTMRETDVTGVGCYEAMRRILGSKFGFYVDPRPAKQDGKPAKVSGKTWGPFQIHFFRRSDGPTANLYLNARGTSMRNAKASVTRIEVASDISKSPNRIQVNGAYVRQLKLVYWGGRTPILSTPLKKTALQHGWNITDGLLSDFAKPGSWVIDALFAGVAAGKREEWLKKYHTKGPDFLKHWATFRLFMWNEANELDPNQKGKYRDQTLYWYAPNLKDIADIPAKPDVWYRRRRKMGDTIFLRNPKLSQWERHAPTLWLTVAPTATSTEWAALKWRRMSESHFRFDAERCAVTFTADDLAEWRPLDKLDSPEADPAKSWPDDPRTFASMLHEGVLRFAVECSVPVDNGSTCIAEPGATAGAPFAREVWIDATHTFVSTLPYTGDGLAVTPSGLTTSPLDARADIQRQADLTRDSAQDEAIHASISTAGDWARQTIGSRIAQTQGRKIDLAGRNGIGAQIVAVRLDVQSYKYELLTESLALAIKSRDRKLFDKKARVYQNAKRATRLSNGE